MSPPEQRLSEREFIPLTALVISLVALSIDAMRIQPFVILPVGLMALGLFAAPFYGDVTGNILWMGKALRSICGF